jgi:AcrR family transcriptional regulator
MPRLPARPRRAGTEVAGNPSVSTSQPAGTEETHAPRSRKGAETRARLVEGAKRVFQDTGFLKARISDIAEEAGVSHGAFYHYFDSKEQIFREVAEAQERLLTEPPTDGRLADSSRDSPRERIRRANRRYLERYRDEARIMGVIEQVSRYDEHVNAARAATQKHFAERAEHGIRRMQADGLVAEHIDPAIAATALGAMVARFAELWLVQDFGSYDFDDVVEQLTTLWCNALGLGADLPATKESERGSVRTARRI